MSVSIHNPASDRLSDRELIAWKDIPVSIVVDLVGNAQIDIAIRPVNPPGKQPKLCGRAFPVVCEPPDFGSVVAALDHISPRDVLVIAADGADHTAMIGEILSGHLRSKGCAGLVCDGAVRDVATISKWDDFAVFTRHINPRGPTGVSQGEVNVPVNLAGRRINPGDLILGDDDGLAVLSPAACRENLDAAQAKLAMEDEWIKALASGKPAAEIFAVDVKPQD